eukprot:2502438-Lingulodinium_polyedra.AAC.1
MPYLRFYLEEWGSSEEVRWDREALILGWRMGLHRQWAREVACEFEKQLNYAAEAAGEAASGRRPDGIFD